MLNHIKILFLIKLYIGFNFVKNVCKLNKKGFLTELKPEQSHKTGFRNKGFWQKDHVGESISNIKNLFGNRYKQSGPTD